MFKLEIGKAKRSERILGQKNTFIRDVESKLKKVLGDETISREVSQNNLENDDEFEKNIEKNLNMIKNQQLKKVVSNASKKVLSAVERQSQRKRQLSIENNYDKINSKKVFESDKENDGSIGNKIVNNSSPVNEKSLKAVKSAKNINGNHRDLIQKSKSSEKIEVLNKMKNKSVKEKKNLEGNVQLYKEIFQYL